MKLIRSAPLTGGGTITGDLTISGDLSVSGSSAITTNEVIQGTSIIDVTNTEAFLVRKDSDGGDVFAVDTTNSRVGIGAVAPGMPLHISGSGNQGVRVESSSNSGRDYDIYTNGGAIFIEGVGGSSGSIYIGENGNYPVLVDLGASANSFVIDGSGNVGIGDTSPDEKLSVYGGLLRIGHDDSNHLTMGRAASGHFEIARTCSGVADQVFFQAKESDGGDISFPAGNVGIGDATPESLLHMKGANPVLTIQDTETSAGSADARIRLAESDGSGNVENYWDIHNSGADLLLKRSDASGNTLVLDANSRISLSNNDSGGTGGEDSTTGNTLFGYLAGAAIASTGTDNTAIGHGALTTNTTGDDNIAIGVDAMGTANHANCAYNVVIGNYAGDAIAGNAVASTVLIGQNAGSAINHADSSGHVLIGSNAGLAITNGFGNTAVGHEALSAATTDDYNTAFGYQSLSNVTGSNVNYNDGFGFRAGRFCTTGQYNVFVGALSGQGITGTKLTGNSNTTVGYKSGFLLQGAATSNTLAGSSCGAAVTTGQYNVIMGFQAGDSLTDQTHNTAIGVDALGGSSAVDQTVIIGSQAGMGAMEATADGTVAVGYAALQALTSGAGNVAVGYQSGLAISKGNYNSVSGYLALSTETVSDRSTAFGYKALEDQIIGGGDNAISGNTAIGFAAGRENVTGTHNTYIGNSAGEGVNGNSNSGNTAVGSNAMLSVTTGGGNTAVGWLALDALTDGASNVAMGYHALSTAGSPSSTIAIGMDACGDGNLSTAGTVVIGHAAGHKLSSSLGSIAIGYQALKTHTEGSRNMAIGYGAMNDTNATAAADGGAGGSPGTLASVDNIFIGYDSGGGTWAGSDSNSNVGIGNYVMDAAMDGALNNTAMGHLAGTAITTGSQNTLLGFQAGKGTTTGQSNTFIGKNAGDTMTTRYYNTCVGQNAGTAVNDSAGHGGVQAFGYNALSAMTTGSQNTAVGYNAGDTTTTGSFNTFVGWESDADAVGDSYQTRIGHYGALRYMTARITMDDFTTVADNDAATAPLLKIPRYGFLKRVTCTVVTANGGGTGEYNISLGTAVEAPGDTVAGRIELIGADLTTNTDFIGATFFQSTRSADGDARVNIETAKHVHIWECGQRTDDSSGWTLFEGAGMYLYVCHANASNATDGTNAVLRITAEYWGEN